MCCPNCYCIHGGIKCANRQDVLPYLGTASSLAVASHMVSHIATRSRRDSDRLGGVSHAPGTAPQPRAAARDRPPACCDLDPPPWLEIPYRRDPAVEAAAPGSHQACLGAGCASSCGRLPPQPPRCPRQLAAGEVSDLRIRLAWVRGEGTVPRPAWILKLPFQRREQL